MMTEPTEPHPETEHLHAALEHVRAMLDANSIAVHAAETLLRGLISMIGTLVGDPDLPEHARSGYQGLLELAREQLWSLRQR